MATKELQSHVVPSAAALQERFANFLSSTREEFRHLSEQVTASFDLDALKVAGERATGNICSDIFLVAEGGFNQIFILTFTDGLEIVARLNRSRDNQDATQPDDLLQHRVTSEAATLKFVRTHTTIPVPKVYAVEPHGDNPVGARYILEERMFGQPLSSCWPYMSSAERDRVVAQIAAFEGQLMQTRFSSIGSIREDTSTHELVVGHLGLSCISPLYLGKDLGPWHSSHDFIKAYVHAELELLEKEPETWKRERIKWRHINHDTGDPPLEYMRALYRLFFDGILRLAPRYPPRDEPSSNAPFVLHHQDISASNVLVAHDDAARVVGIVDWEGARVAPLWSCVYHDHLLRNGSLPNDELTRLRALRRQIHIAHEPAAIAAGDESVVIRCLFYLSAFQYSTQKSIEQLNSSFTKYISLFPPADAVFEDLISYINLYSTKQLLVDR